MQVIWGVLTASAILNSMPSRIKYIAILVVALLAPMPSSIFASEPDSNSVDVTIEDTGGTVRGSGSVIDGKSAIEFHLQDGSGNPAEGAEVTLTNKSDPAVVLKATSTAGSVVFADVVPGTWVVATQNPAITFMDVMFLSDPAALGAGAAVGGGLASGSAISASLPLYAIGAGVLAVPVVAVANENKKSGRNDEGSSGTRTPTPVSTSEPQPTAVPTRRPTPVPTPIDETPISPAS